jgi:hypothetical protein
MTLGQLSAHQPHQPRLIPWLFSAALAAWQGFETAPGPPSAKVGRSSALSSSALLSATSAAKPRPSRIRVTATETTRRAAGDKRHW